MEEIPKLNKNIETSYNWDQFLVNKMSEVTEEEIKRFNTLRVIPDFRKIFEEEPMDIKIGLVALDKLTDKELRALSAYQEEVTKKRKLRAFLIGFHDVASKLAELRQFTERKF